MTARRGPQQTAPAGQRRPYRKPRGTPPQPWRARPDVRYGLPRSAVARCDYTGQCERGQTVRPDPVRCPQDPHPKGVTLNPSADRNRGTTVNDRQDDTPLPGPPSSATPPALAPLLTRYGLLGAVRSYRTGGPGPKATLLTLAECMGSFHIEETGEEWWECSIFQSRLAYETEQGLRTVRRHLADFIERGIVASEPRRAKGRLMGNTYVMRYENLARLQTVTPEAKMAAGPPEATAERDLSGSSKASQPLRVASGAVASGAATAPAPRRRDLLFDAICEVDGKNPSSLSRNEASNVGGVKKRLLDLGADADELRRRAKRYKEIHPTWHLSARAVLSHWSELEAVRDGYRAAPWMDYA